MNNLSKEELGFLEKIKPRIKDFLDNRTEIDIDNGIGSFLLSEKGYIYHGVPFGTARWIHGEENAIGSMVTEEGIEGKIKIILIVGGDVTLPCGMCRVAILKYGSQETSILCGNLSLSRIKKFSIEELYPHGACPDF